MPNLYCAGRAPPAIGSMLATGRQNTTFLASAFQTNPLPNDAMIAIEITHPKVRLYEGAGSRRRFIGYECAGVRWMMEGEYYDPHDFLSGTERIYNDGPGRYFREHLKTDKQAGPFGSLTAAMQPGALEAARHEEEAHPTPPLGKGYSIVAWRDGRPVYEPL